MSAHREAGRAVPKAMKAEDRLMRAVDDYTLAAVAAVLHALSADGFKDVGVLPTVRSRRDTMKRAIRKALREVPRGR